MVAGRSRLAWERLLREGGVAPRMARSLPQKSCKLSQTSLRPIEWVSCAKSSATTWLQGLNVRARSAAPVSRANWGTKASGYEIAELTQNGELGAGWRLVFFIFQLCRVAEQKPVANLFSHQPVGWL